MDISIQAKPPTALNYEGMVDDLFKEMGSPSATMIHAAVGVAGETGELILADANMDRLNILEEAGDSIFYLQKLLNMHSWTIGSLIDRPHALQASLQRFKPVTGAAFEASNLLDDLKKVWVYEKTLNTVELANTLGRYLHYLDMLLASYNYTFDDARDYNQWKLCTGPKARYPSGKYTNQAAIARADKAA